MITCTCTVPHREHEFRPGEWGLCTVCGHSISVHKGGYRHNDTRERIAALLRSHDLINVAVADHGTTFTLTLELEK